MSQEYIIGSNIEPLKTAYKNLSEIIWYKLNQLDDSKVCLINAQNDEHLTIGDIKTRANSIAVALIKRGITKRDKIAFCGQTSLQQIVFRFVTYFMGNTSVIMNMNAVGNYELEQAVRYTEAKVVVCSAKCVQTFESFSLKLVVVVDGDNDTYVTYDQLLEEGRDQMLDRIPYFDVKEDDILVMCFSSGTTGASKCIMQSHRSFMDAMIYNEFWINFKSKNTGLFLSLGLIAGNTLVLLIVFGIKMTFFTFPLDVPLIMGAIEKYGINCLMIPPVITRRLFYDNSPDSHDISCLKTLLIFADIFPSHISESIHDRYGFQMNEMYGMSEILCITNGPNDHDEFIPGNLGRPSPGTQVKIVDLNTGKPLGPNMEGEICVRGMTLFSGYYKNDVLTKEAFDSEGWLRTGDIGHYDHKERLFLIDRVKALFYSGSATDYIRISPIELEKFLLTHKSIADVAVVGVSNTAGAKWPRAYVVLEVGHEVSAEQIEKYVSDNMNYNKRLKAGVFFVDVIKRTALGKIMRKYYNDLVMDEVIQ